MNIMALLAVLLSLVIFYIVGSLVLIACRIPLRENAYYDTFVRTLAGVISIVSLYAIVKTGCNTILWGFILIGLLYMIYACKHQYLSRKYEFKAYFSGNIRQYTSIGVLLLLGVIFFIFQGLFFYASPINKMPHGDYAYYATLQGILGNYGVESVNWENVVFGGSRTPAPYHYFDIWLSLIYVLCSFSAYESQVVISQAIFMAILALGMIAFTRCYTTNRVMQILSVLSVFFAGLLIVNILPQSKDFIFSNSCSLKYVTASLFIVWSAILMANKKDTYYFALLCLPILNIITAPAVFIVIALLLLYKAIKEKSIKLQCLSMVNMCVVAVFIIAFYFLQAGTSVSGGLSFSSLIEAFSEDKLKPVKIIAGAAIIMISIYAYYFVPSVCAAIGKNRKQYWKKVKANGFIIVSMLLLGIVGLFIWSITHVVADSIQFFMVTGMTAFNLIIWLLLLLSYNDHTKWNYLLFSYIILLFAANIVLIKTNPFYRYHNVNKDIAFVKDVTNEIKTMGHPMGIFCRDTSELVDYWSFNNFSIGAEYKHYLNELYITSVYPYPNLDKYFIKERPRIQSTTDNKPFIKYSKEYEKTHGKSKYEDVLQCYIQHYNCKFIILSAKAEMPCMPQINVTKTFTDANTGIKVLFIE